MSERKIQRAQSGSKQRRKSTSHLLEGSRSLSATSLSTSIASPNHDLKNLGHLSEPKRDKPTLSRNASSSSMIRQRKYSEIIAPKKSDLNISPVHASNKSLDNSNVSGSPQTPGQNMFPAGNKDAMSYLYSTEREISIEEEQYQRIDHLYQVILLWKKRWKHQRDHNILLTQKLDKIESEYSGVCESMREIFENKLQKLRDEVKKAATLKDEIVKEKRSLESSFKHMLEHAKKEKGLFVTKISDQAAEIESLHKSVKDQANELQVLQSRIEEYAKKDANNNEVSMHNRSLQEENKNLSNRLKSFEKQLKEANLTYETHKQLLDTTLEKLKSLEQCVPRRYRTSKWKRQVNSRYVMRVDQSNPLNMYIEDLDHTNSAMETQSMNSLDSLESIPEHLDSPRTRDLNEGILHTPAHHLKSDTSLNSIPPNYKDALKYSDSTYSGSSYQNNGGSTCSTPSVFSDCQSPISNLASPDSAKSRTHSRKHSPLQKSNTIEGEVTPMNSPASIRSMNGLSPDSPDTVPIKDAIHSVPDLRKFNQSTSPETYHVQAHITHSASQLPTYTADEDNYINHVRKGSIDADFLLSDTMKRKKKKSKSNHQRRGSLDFDILTAQTQKTQKSSRFDFLNKNKNGIVVDDDIGSLRSKGRKSKGFELGAIFSKLTSSSSNLHDTDKKQGFQKKRKARSLKERR